MNNSARPYRGRLLILYAVILLHTAVIKAPRFFLRRLKPFVIPGLPFFLRGIEFPLKQQMITGELVFSSGLRCLHQTVKL